MSGAHNRERDGGVFPNPAHKNKRGFVFLNITGVVCFWTLCTYLRGVFLDM